MTSPDEKKQTIREKAFQESFELGQKQRFGLFTQPVTLALGDDNYFKTKAARKDADGLVITEPRNFTTKNPKKGHIDSVLFMKPDYVSVGDPYKDAGKLQMRVNKKDGHKDAGHDMAFKPAKTVKQGTGASYEHMSDYKEVKINRKGPDGVITEPRNFLTSPPKKGKIGKGTTLSEKIDYIEDPFNRKKELDKKEREEHYKKLQDKPFSQKVKGKETFFTIKEQYGEDPPIPQRKPPAKRDPLMTHDAPFKPSNPPKRGYNKTLDKFPEYKPNPMRVVERKHEEDDKAKWKPPKLQKQCIPSASVVTNYRNLKSEFPSVFRRI